MVERQEQEPKDHLKKGRAKVHQRFLEAGLNGHHIKEAVHHFGHIASDQALQIQAWNAVDKIKGSPHEEHLSDMLADIELMDIHPAVEDGGQDDDHHDQIQGGGGLPGDKVLYDGLQAQR